MEGRGSVAAAPGSASMPKGPDRGDDLVRGSIAPEDATAQCDEQRQNRELGAAHALIAAVAVVPGDTSTIGRPTGAQGLRPCAAAAASHRSR